MTKKPTTKKSTTGKKTVKKAAAKKITAKETASKKAATKAAIKKKPATKRAVKQAAVQTAAKATLNAILESLEDNKAENIVTIDLIGKSSIADYLVIASGRSSRQVGSLATKLVEHLKEKKLIKGAANIEGKRSGDWVLVDAGDVIVHLFRPEVREFYNLEKMWTADIPETED